MKKMLINARQAEETRIAIVDNVQLMDLDIESVDREQKKANIYKAKISRIEPSLNAVFVNYGEDKNGFLPFKEISPEYFKKTAKDQDTPLNELLDVGQELIVQIAKEERGSKGAALTTFITLAGCYMVLMPNNPSAGGISRRIEGDERQKLKALFDSLTIPANMGVIIRTAGVDRSADEIQADLDTLTTLWDAIKRVSYQRKAPFLIHKESDITIRAIRDHLKEDIKEIIIDDEESYEDLKRQLSMLRPGFVERLQLYKKDLPLFNAFQIEKQIESAFKREVQLPSGGSIVIDTTEALTAIDINSARSTKGDNIEETAFETNLEAAEEIARQLRLRDLGGLIVVDFIDMAFFPNQKAVEQKLVDALFHDRARIQMTRISKFGLVEISRQRLQASLGESVMHSCPRCAGHGFIRSIPSLALSILRNVHAEAVREKTNELRVQLPIDVATFLLNEKRDELSQIEEGTSTKVTLIPNANLQSPHYSVQRIWGDAYTASRPSYDLIEDKKDVELYKAPKQDKSKQPALKSADYNQPSHNTSNNSDSKKTEDKPQVNKELSKETKHNKAETKGFWAKLSAFFFSDKEASTECDARDQKPSQKSTQPKKGQQDRADNKNNERNNQRDKSQSRDGRNNDRDNNRRDNRNNNKNQHENKPRHQQQSDERNDHHNKSTDARDNNDNRNDRGNKNDRNDRNNRNDRNDRDRGNKGNRSNNRNNQRLQVHQSEEMVDIAALKKDSPEAQKAAKEKAIMKTISTTPEEKISVMVKEVLAEVTTLASDQAVQIETHASQTRKVKYLNFEVVDTQALTAQIAKEEKLKQKELAKQAKEAQESTAEAEEIGIIIGETTLQSDNSTTDDRELETVEASDHDDNNKQERKPRPRKSARKPAHMEYSPAVDVNSQGYITKA
ncbi:ribonuclease E/G [Cysteiniphilum sp. JM-1]|uniref:Rne/Rng family ribonuclease n=1 Tax=Cysteiniphilum sp. JM-1 TaxID=2610891 RepID=UPI0012460374|nr:Rne/Rng family ribonuclease [Cysteiniphilum sp. JM-1]